MKLAIDQLAKSATVIKVQISFKDFSAKDTDAGKQLATIHQANESRIRVRKDIISVKENAPYAALMAKRSEIRKMFYSYTLSYSGDGYRLLPNSSFMEFEKRFIELSAEFKRAADQFCHPDNLYAARQQARINLNGMFHDSLIPDSAELREKYSVDIRRGLIADVSSASLDGEILKKITEQVLTQQEADLLDGYRRAYSELGEHVGKLAATLRAYGPGKQLRDSILSNVADMGESLQRLNLFGDPRLDEIATTAQTLTTWTSAEEIKSSPSTRAHVAIVAESLGAEIDAELAKLARYN